MTKIDVAALRALMEKATKGPYEVCEHSWQEASIYGADGYRVAGMSIDDNEDTADEVGKLMAANASLLAAALNALPALLDAYEELQDFKAQLRAAEEKAFRQLPAMIEAVGRIEELEAELAAMRARCAS
jgi:predicted S18 family serine protease